MARGTRRQVWNGTAKRTSGGLTKADLMISKSSGKIVSRKASAAATRNRNLGDELGNWQDRKGWKNKKTRK